ncbi:lytic murein transglycosylase B [Candidatus Nitrotoga sp. 1052]|uniref:lytic murein transglycosylase B n=1 Tax=Candidatus Nitrotoga sp. 1052 TaxID=2886964 RepID=UPI001EF4FFEB|nr:lytic murein transglycosylase B [Candidatus Nitrotoga sp. 1052]CAH1086631.1 Membrane-bound lytic murein transglycosylase B [Candidatus Nitrotoga sp. 1052]
MMNWLCFALLLLSIPSLGAIELPGIPQFIDEMVVKHQFKRDELELIFQRAQYRQAVINMISAPATIKPWPQYRAAFINNKHISDGLKFWQNHISALQRAEKEYGVPQEMIVAVIGVETNYGRNTGKFNMLDTLTTLAFDYPRRADFFRNELEQYLLLAREQKFEPFKIQGSYAGALGIPQFMPSSYRKHAVDYNNDGIINLFNDPEDAIGSVANYFKQYGWQSGEPVAARVKLNEKTELNIKETRSMADWAELGVIPVAQTADLKSAWLLDFTVSEGKEFWLAFKNFQVIMLYNNNIFYAMSVYQLADALHYARILN